MEPPSQSSFRLFPGLWIVLGISAILAVRMGWSWLHYPHQLEQLAREFSSFNAYREAPVINHTGTMLGMIHNTPDGVGVFLANLTDKTEIKICEEKGSDDMGDPDIFGWAPGDDTIAYRWDVTLRFANNDGKTEPGEIETPFLAAFTWLSPDRCAYIDTNANADNSMQLAVAQMVGGAWKETSSWPLQVTDGKPRSLQTFATNVVVWQTDHSIWQMDLASGETKTLFSNPGGVISSLSYSRETGKFLFVEAVNRRLSDLVAWSGGVKKTLSAQSGRMENAQWIDQGRGYVYSIAKGENSELRVKTDVEPKEQTFFSDGQVASVFGGGERSRVYVLASWTNEAPSVWCCDLNDGSISRLFSPWGFTNLPVHFQPALVGYAPMPNKHNERFVLIPPAHFSFHKKYPLVIGMQGYDWMNVAHATYSQALANCGVYVALTGYHYMHQSQEALLDYTNNVTAVYDQLIKNPNVDRNRVYLFAFSSSTLVVNHLIDSYPGRWRGIMLFNPTARLPVPDVRPFPPLLATAGSDENWLWKQFPDYQENLAQAGTPVEWFVHPNESHIERSKDTLYQRTLLMGRMIFGN